MTDLPSRTCAVDGWAIRCPWCREHVDEAPVTLGTLFETFERRALLGSGNWLWQGREFNDGLPVDCPNCAKPFVCRLVTEETWPKGAKEYTLVAAPIRTDKDKAFEADLAERDALG